MFLWCQISPRFSLSGDNCHTVCWKVIRHPCCCRRLPRRCSDIQCRAMTSGVRSASEPWPLCAYDVTCTWVLLGFVTRLSLNAQAKRWEREEEDGGEIDSQHVGVWEGNGLRMIAQEDTKGQLHNGAQKVEAITTTLRYSAYVFLCLF